MYTIIVKIPILAIPFAYGPEAASYLFVTFASLPIAIPDVTVEEVSPIATPACTAEAFFPIATPEPDDITVCKSFPFLSVVGAATTLAPSPKEIALATFVEALGPIAIALFSVAPSLICFLHHLIL